MCVLADPYMKAHQVRTLQRAVEETGIDIPLVLVHEPVNPIIDPDEAAEAVNERFGMATLRVARDTLQADGAWTLVYAERRFAELFGWEVPSMDRIPVEEAFSSVDAEFRTVTPMMDGPWAELPAETVELIGERCDLGVRFGFGLLRGDVLQAPEFGVLSFHPADIRQYRGLGVPQAWFEGRETMGVTLQRLNDDIDAGEIIAYGETDVSDCPTLWDAYEAVHEVKAGLLAEGIERLRDPDFEPTIPEELGDYYPVDRRRALEFVGRTLFKNVTGRLRAGAVP